MAKPPALAAHRSLLTPDGAYDRRAIMADAHRQRRLMASHGWSWGRCLGFSWAKAKAQRATYRQLAERAEVERYFRDDPKARELLRQVLAQHPRLTRAEAITHLWAFGA